MKTLLALLLLGSSLASTLQGQHSTDVVLDPRDGTNATATNSTDCRPCGTLRYPRNTHICYRGIVCPRSMPNLCGRSCYDSSVFICSGDVLWVSGVDQQVC